MTKQEIIRIIELEKYFDEFEPIDSEENESGWKELVVLRKKLSNM